MFTTDTVNGGGDEHQALEGFIAVITLEFIDWHGYSLLLSMDNIVAREVFRFFLSAGP